jgi:hypothetical protein
MMLALKRASAHRLRSTEKFSGACAMWRCIVESQAIDLQSEATANSRVRDLASSALPIRHAGATTQRTRGPKYDVVACRSHVLVDTMLSTELTGTA